MNLESRLEKLKFANNSISEEMALERMQKDFDRKIEELRQPELDLDFVYLSTPPFVEFSRMLQEWRVSIYAQHLKTQMPVSEKRLSKFWQRKIVKSEP